VLFPCTCVLKPILVHLHQTSSLLPSPLPIVATASLRLLYSLQYSQHTNYIQVLGFLPFPYSSCVHSPLTHNPCLTIILHLFHIYNLHMRENVIFALLRLTLLKMMFSSSIHLLVTDKISFFYMAE
jgi:hypothetical protein